MPGEISEKDRLEVDRLYAEACKLNTKRVAMQTDFDRAATRPATQYTREASGAREGEPMGHFARALLYTLLQLGVSREKAAKFMDTGGGQDDKGDKGKGHKGQDDKGHKGKGHLFDKGKGHKAKGHKGKR